MSDADTLASWILHQHECLVGRKEEQICESGLYQYRNYDLKAAGTLWDGIALSNSLFNPYNPINNTAGRFFVQLPGYTYSITSRSLGGVSEMMHFEGELEGSFMWCGAMAGLVMAHMHATGSCIRMLNPLSSADVVPALEATLIGFPFFTSNVNLFDELLEVSRSAFPVLYQGVSQVIGRTIPSFSPFLFLTSLEEDVWYAIMISLVAASIASVLLRRGKLKPTLQRMIFIFKVIILYIGLFMIEQVPDFVQCRINHWVFIVWLLACVVLSTIFMGSLLELMSKSDDPYKPTSAKSLLEYPFLNWKLHFIKETSEAFYATSIDNGALVERLAEEDRLVAYELFDTDLPNFASDMIGQIFEGGHLILTFEANFLNIFWPQRNVIPEEVIRSINIERPLWEDLGFVGIREVGDGTTPGFFDSFSQVILAVQESGLHGVWLESNLQFMRRALPKPKTESYEDMQLKNLTGLWYIFIYGIAGCMLIFIIELLVCGFQKMVDKHQSARVAKQPKSKNYPAKFSKRLTTASNPEVVTNQIVDSPVRGQRGMTVPHKPVILRFYYPRVGCWNSVSRRW